MPPTRLLMEDLEEYLSERVESILKDKSGVDKIIVKKQPYQLLNTNREFLPSFGASNFHKLVNESL